MKTCSKCSIEKETDDFYKHSRYADGHQGVCKECQRERSIEREQWPEKQAAYVKYRSSEKGKNTHTRCQKAYAHRNPDKMKAHSLVCRAITSGELSRGVCEVCGIEKTQGHHDDYSKPLDVRWLCYNHHREHHQQQNLVGG